MDQPKTLQITVTVQEYEVIMNLLAQAPLGQVYNLFNRLSQQAQPQLATNPSND